jgi:S-adenosylmethionine decarboxylase
MKKFVFGMLFICSAAFLGASIDNVHQVEEGKKTYHEFVGEHLMANYMDCDTFALNDIESLKEVMKKAATEAGATVLHVSEHIFEPDGFSMIILLSESHASIHTYPEYNSCFVDFFTCGTSCFPKEFNKALKKYLKPKKTSAKLFLRDVDIVEKNNR